MISEALSSYNVSNNQRRTCGVFLGGGEELSSQLVDGIKRLLHTENKQFLKKPDKLIIDQKQI